MDSDRLVTVQRVVSPVDCSAGPSNVSSMTHQETLAPQPTHAILTPVPVRHFIEITNTRSDDSLQKSLSLMSTEKKKYNWKANLDHLLAFCVKITCSNLSLLHRCQASKVMPHPIMIWQFLKAWEMAMRRCQMRIKGWPSLVSGGQCPATDFLLRKKK